MYGLFLGIRLRLPALYLTTELPFVAGAMSAVKSLAKKLNHPDVNTVGILASLELHLDCGWSESALHIFYRHLVQHSSQTLQHLRVVLKSNAAVKRARTDTTLQNVVSGLHFPKLGRLEIEMDTARFNPGRLAGMEGKALRRRHLKPSCQVFDAASFLQQHLGTLIHVRFRNVFFAPNDPTSPSSTATLAAASAVSVTLDLLERQPCRLQRLNWIINRIQHDPRCKRSNDEPMPDCRKFECGSYLCEGSYSFRVEDLDTLAEDVGGRLDGDSNTWDFGERLTSRLLGGR